MKSIWKKLPDDMVNEILSYGDPEIFKKFKDVMEQIKLLRNEFLSLRGHQHSIWRYHPETNFLYYALRCCFIKNVIEKRAAKRARISASNKINKKILYYNNSL